MSTHCVETTPEEEQEEQRKGQEQQRHVSNSEHGVIGLRGLVARNG